MICAFSIVVELDVGIGPLAEVVAIVVEHFTGEVVEEDKVFVVVPVAVTYTTEAKKSKKRSNILMQRFILEKKYHRNEMRRTQYSITPE